MSREAGLRDGPIEQYVLDSAGHVTAQDMILTGSLYSQHMRSWLQYFPLEQFLIIDTQDLIDNPLGVTTQVEKFLDLQRKITEDNFVLNKTKGFYCFRKDARSQTICMNEAKGRKHPEISSSLERKLRKYFAPFNKQFYRMVGRDFGWPE